MKPEHQPNSDSFLLSSPPGDSITLSSPSLPEKGGMGLFAELITELNSSTKTNDKLDALSDYFVTADEKDKVWMIAIFSGRRPKRAVNSTLLRTWCAEATNLPQWLFDESYHTVGDLAETIALLLPETK